MRDISFYGSRANWHYKRVHSPFNLNFFIPTLEGICKMIALLMIAWVLNYYIKPFEHLEQYAIAKELKRQEEYIKESQETELNNAKYYIEQLELQQKYKREEEARVLHKKLIEECAKKYKIGDRIKIYDMNAPMVKEGDCYRWSIGNIDVITNIVDYTLYCESGNKYSCNEQIEKVSSKREWRDLVNMCLKGQLTFVDIDMEGAP